jgi:hypothetical protein
VANPEIKHVSDRSTPSAEFARPACDEWGVYDPEQAGFEAVLRKLESRDDAARVNATPVAQSAT